MSDTYSIRIIKRDGQGQTRDDFHATVTRLADGKQLVFTSDFKPWLKRVLLRQSHIEAEFRYLDMEEEELNKVEEFRI